jgi:CRISPR-associated protein (TIGR02584 family)
MRTTLVTVSGMSPAIITETLWALASEAPAVVPDDVVVITTTRGRRDIEEMLLTNNPAWGRRKVWERLRADILQRTGQPKKSTKLQLAVQVIDLPDENTGVRRPADDLRTRGHNDEAADFIIRTLAPYCDAADNHVIASIAGGRKTMGALLYAAMSLIGKESDRVTHVLVNEPFENCPGFFYPDQPVQDLAAQRFGQAPSAVAARSAIIEMADIPFVPLRNKFAELDEPRRTFAGLVEAYSRAERKVMKQPPRVTLDADKGTLTIEGRPIQLAGRDLLIFAFLHQRALRTNVHFANKDEAQSELAEFMAGWKRDHPSHQATARLSGGVSIDDIPKALASLRKKLEQQGLTGAIPHLAPERSRIGFDLRAG